MKKCDISRHLLTVVFPFRPLWFVSTSPQFLFLRGLSYVRGVYWEDAVEEADL
jgi:hypothetical protein